MLAAVLSLKPYILYYDYLFGTENFKNTRPDHLETYVVNN